MPVMDGRAALEKIMELPSPPPVVVITADQSLRSAIDAVKAGARDYVAKPYEIDELRHVVGKALEAERLRRENRRLAEQVRRLGGSGDLLGESRAMGEVFEIIERVAPTRASVLITGETGTGKELAARRIHELGPDPSGPFVTTNCAAIPETLVESELFGHRRGAFTGADRDRIGRFQEADGGTLFLDEIGDMPLPVQGKLLRVLQDGVVEPLGGGHRRKVDVRIVAATHRDLKEKVADGSFRDDLLFRIRVVELPMPPLRARDRDILLLAGRFLEDAGRGEIAIDPVAERALLAYPWPGNVRELRNAVERAAIFCREGVVRTGDLPADILGEEGGPAAPGREPPAWDPEDDFRTAKKKVVEAFERQAIQMALVQARGNVSEAARSLGMHRQNLQQKIKQLRIHPAEYK
jgi:DNA-binding NtrC family response regulator